MAIADNKERLAITLDKSTVEEIKDIAERETRSVSNVIQILVDHGLHDRGKYRLGPAWCDQVLHTQITFERGFPPEPAYIDESGFEQPELGGGVYLDLGQVVDVVEWKDAMHLVVEVARYDENGYRTDDKELLFVYPSQIVKVIGERDRPLFSRASTASVLPDASEQQTSVGKVVDDSAHEPAKAKRGSGKPKRDNI